MPNLSLNGLKQIAKMRHIKGYQSMSKVLLMIERSVNNFNNDRIKKIREDFNKLKDRFLKPKIKKLEEAFTK